MRAKVQTAVYRAIESAQEAGGLSSAISGGTRPMRDLQDFDSLVAACATLDISAELGCEISENMYLFNTENGEARTVDEIVDRLCEILEQGAA